MENAMEQIGGSHSVGMPDPAVVREDLQRQAQERRQRAEELIRFKREIEADREGVIQQLLEDLEEAKLIYEQTVKRIKGDLADLGYRRPKVVVSVGQTVAPRSVPKRKKRRAPATVGPSAA